MGIYLNPGTMRFQTALNGEIYVDKTEMIVELNKLVNTPQKYVSVSRPRRFGKSMAADMLCAYYERTPKATEMFSGLKLAERPDWDRYLGKYDAIRLVMTEFIGRGRSVTEALARMQKLIARDLRGEYPEVDLFDPEDLLQTMTDIRAQKGVQFVIILDEWDAVFREYRDDAEGQREYLDFLRDWLKDRDYIALAYMTGILPIKKYGKHSALNMFGEYSMTFPLQLAPFAGFTAEEVAGLCRAYGRDYEQFREWYDGYRVSDIIPPDPDHEIQRATGSPPEAKTYSLYSPLSAVNAVRTGYIRNYWNSTETYEALAEYIRMDYDGLKDAVAFLMDGNRVKVDLSTYQNDMTTFYSKDDIFALLIHLGYLGYDSLTGEVFIPNREILDEFKASTKTPEWEPAIRALQRSKKLLLATWDGKAEKVAEFLEEFHDRAENKTYNTESALSYAVQLAYYSAQKFYTVIQELDTGKGYADIVFLPSPKYPDKPAMLVELKHGKSTESAMDQIRSRNYPQALEHYRGNILLVAVNYNSDARSDEPDFKRHSCVIERA